MSVSGLALVGLGLALGLRHGIDWDHIAAITDITSSVITTEEQSGRMIAAGACGQTIDIGLHTGAARINWSESRLGFFLATLYALGHASVVVLLGLLAIWAGTILPAWLDPLMERIVGITLVLLGVWIFYSLWRYGRSFRLQSRWMLVFALIGRGWAWLKSRLTGHAPAHRHPHDIAQYGSRTAFGIGMLHGIGAETGSQALLLAGAAGATSQMSGSVMLLSFVVGLVISNSLIAVFSSLGFVSSSTKRNVYMAVGIIAGVFSLVVGSFFILGRGGDLPDLQAMINGIFGTLR